jgi:ADP-ribose pyrophosphatase
MTNTPPTAGVFQLDTPCWTILTADGVPAGFEESEHHFDTESQARDAASGYQRPDDPPVQIVQRESRCWAAILHNGELFVHQGDDDGVHFDSEATLLELLAAGGHVQLPTGKFTCGDDADCDECDPLRKKIKQELAEQNSAALPNADPDVDPSVRNWWAYRRTSALSFPIHDGRPVNPFQPHLPYGRGQLPHWGEWRCSDAIVLVDLIGGGRLLLLGERADGNGWAVPGGRLRKGETALQGGLRELAEETGIRPDVGADIRVLRTRYVPDPRATREAWLVTTPLLIKVGPRHYPLNTICASDLLRCSWFGADSFADLERGLDAGGHKLFEAHRRMLTDILDGVL